MTDELTFAHSLSVEIARLFAVPLALAGARHNNPRRSRCRECNPAGNPRPLAAKYRPGPKAARMRGRRR